MLAAAAVVFVIKHFDWLIMELINGDIVSSQEVVTACLGTGFFRTP